MHCDVQALWGKSMHFTPKLDRFTSPPYTPNSTDFTGISTMETQYQNVDMSLKDG